MLRAFFLGLLQPLSSCSHIPLNPGMWSKTLINASLLLEKKKKNAVISLQYFDLILRNFENHTVLFPRFVPVNIMSLSTCWHINICVNVVAVCSVVFHDDHSTTCSYVPIGKHVNCF